MKTVIVYVEICDVWFSGQTDRILNHTNTAVESVRVESVPASVVATAFGKVIL